VDWNLLKCGIGGHVSYAPDEPAVRARLQTTSAAGEAWRCLRCGTFVSGAPLARGPAAKAPAVRRGKELRSAFILRLFAVERFLRAIAVAVIAYAIWRFKYSVVRTVLRSLGLNIDHSKLIGLIRHAFTLDPRTLTWLAWAAAGYALIELLESIGLWLLKRWGEYFAMVATSVGIPYEIYDLSSKVTVLRAAFFAVNVALVVYLVLTKRLFGARGGKHAYDARLRSESIMDSALAAQYGPDPPASPDARAGAAVPADGTDVPDGQADVPDGGDVPDRQADVPDGGDVPVNGSAAGPVSPAQPGPAPRR
jgi:uncharacterized membrane protein (DUF2068 family)